LPPGEEIDSTGEYPKDIFEAFRDAGLLGLCLPESVGGSGAGILGSPSPLKRWPVLQTAALMLLLTRLPTVPS